MDSLGRWETNTYKASIYWDKKLPLGAITYEVKVIDKRSGLASEPVQIEFQVLGKGGDLTKPVYLAPSLRLGA